MIEKIKRIPIVAFLYRIFHLRYGTCGICGLPWSNCDFHIIDITDKEAFFPVCEYCWEHCNAEQIKQACDKLHSLWESQGQVPYTIDEMHQAVDANRLKLETGNKNEVLRH